jgi:hypothetical protein
MAMEENDVLQGGDDARADFPMPLENGYAKRSDSGPSDFSEVVEDLAFFW